MKEITAYVAGDGTVFTKKKDCTDRDNLIEYNKDIIEFSNKYSVPLVYKDNGSIISVGPDLICMLEHAE